MKRIFAILLCVALLLAGCGGGTTETQPQTQETTAETTAELTPVCDGKTLKILAIGNSFSNNTTQYLYEIAKAEGVEEIILGRLYIGGCPLVKHVNNSKDNLPNYTYYKNTVGAWEKTENATLLYGLQDEDWDIITMQQASGSSGQPETYDVLPQLIEYVNQNKTNPDAKLVWHMTWAYQSDSDHAEFPIYANNQEVMYNQILSAYEQKVAPTGAFSCMIPAGTAIQNARSSYLGDKLTADGYHLNDTGKLIASYMWYASLVGKPLEQVNLKYGVGNVQLTDELRQVIVESVNNALSHPMETIPSQYTK